MSEKITLSERLQLIADWVPSGSRLIDIGTDHALLPLYLLLQGKIETAIGVDRSQQPLKQARRRRDKHSVQAEQLSLLHSDGLHNVSVQQGDIAVLAGMGGRTMMTILSSPKVKDLAVVIVQPNRNVVELRSFLAQHNWQITQEHITLENQQLYTTMMARPGPSALSPREAYLGPVLLREQPPEWWQWLRKQHEVLQKIQKQTGVAGMPAEKRERLRWITEILSC